MNGVEDAPKSGRLPGMVATSSLELGVDMGAIDLVVQLETPLSVASGIQWIGRAGPEVRGISLHFVAEARQQGFRDRVASHRRLSAVGGTRRVTKHHILSNQANRTLLIDPSTSAIAIDGQPLPPFPTDALPLNRRYLLLRAATSCVDLGRPRRFPNVSRTWVAWATAAHRNRDFGVRFTACRQLSAQVSERTEYVRPVLQKRTCMPMHVAR